jgi:hypothetical protein
LSPWWRPPERGGTVPRHYLLGFLACMLAVGAGGVWGGSQIDANTHGVERTSSAVYKSCVLLSNAITSTQDPKVQKGTKILVAAILSHMPEKQQAAYFKAVADAPPLVAPDCRALSKHPGEIKLQPTVTPQPTVVKRTIPQRARKTPVPSPSP